MLLKLSGPVPLFALHSPLKDLVQGPEVTYPEEWLACVFDFVLSKNVTVLDPSLGQVLIHWVDQRSKISLLTQLRESATEGELVY